MLKAKSNNITMTMFLFIGMIEMCWRNESGWVLNRGKKLNKSTICVKHSFWYESNEKNQEQIHLRNDQIFQINKRWEKVATFEPTLSASAKQIAKINKIFTDDWWCDE